MMCSKIAWIAIALIVLAGFGLSLLYLPEMPERMPSHWNIRGEIDGYMPRDIALWLMPGISLFMAVLFFVLPKIDPLRKNYAYFMPYFQGLIVILMVFFLYMHYLMISAGLGAEIQMNYMLFPAMSLLFLYIAVMLRKAKRNWFVGIRTPWTLSSDVVWDKTHKLGSVCFLLLAIMMPLVLFVPEDWKFWGMIVPILLFAFIPVVYSYFIWAKEQKKGKR